jgi:hypothetical protein
MAASGGGGDEGETGPQNTPLRRQPSNLPGIQRSNSSASLKRQPSTSVMPGASDLRRPSLPHGLDQRLSSTLVAPSESLNASLEMSIGGGGPTPTQRLPLVRMGTAMSALGPSISGEGPTQGSSSSGTEAEQHMRPRPSIARGPSQKALTKAASRKGNFFLPPAVGAPRVTGELPNDLTGLLKLTERQGSFSVPARSSMDMTGRLSGGEGSLRLSDPERGGR